MIASSEMLILLQVNQFLEFAIFLLAPVISSFITDLILDMMEWAGTFI